MVITSVRPYWKPAAALQRGLPQYEESAGLFFRRTFGVPRCLQALEPPPLVSSLFSFETALLMIIHLITQAVISRLTGSELQPQSRASVRVLVSYMWPTWYDVSQCCSLGVFENEHVISGVCPIALTRGQKISCVIDVDALPNSATRPVRPILWQPPSLAFSANLFGRGQEFVDRISK